jgi:16S rRNA (guanine966-N2)-methyltransferase|tara:strand:- start:333 stop:893 length:561 start_codon:yes stop_codon:yes gene_type:complete
MRIIRGFKKGKRLLLPDNKNTRPLKDIFKEAIFNILEHSNQIKIKINGSNVLDLFAGVGSFGLECLSRGANKVVFFENSNLTLKVLKKNIQNLNYVDKSEIFEKDLYKKEALKYAENSFNFVFIDFPFKETKVFELLCEIKKKKILKKKALIIFHRFWKSKDKLPKEFNVLIQKKYSKSKLIIGSF